MYISKLQIVNYRNFKNETAYFKRGVNTIIGENGSGKSNLLRAIRLLIDDTMLRMAHRLDESDFYRGLDSWKGHWIIIGLEFSDVSQDEAIQSLFLHGVGNVGQGAVTRATYNLIFRPKINIRKMLAELDPGDQVGLEALRQTITIADYETIFTGKSASNFTDPSVYKSIVGDFDAVSFPNEISNEDIGGIVPGIFSISKEIGFTFIQALRDVVSDFQNNRTNLLCLPTLDHPKLEFSGFAHDDGLVASPGKCNALGTLYPMALCGLSSL